MQFLWLCAPCKQLQLQEVFQDLVVSLAREVLRSDYPTFSPEVCLPPLLETGWELDLRSLGIGILLGLALGPVIDTIFVIRQAWFGALQRGARNGRAAFRKL